MKEKFNEIGFKGWSETEVLEYMLYNVYRQGDTNPVAHKLLEYGGGNLVELMRMSTDVNMISEVTGAGESTVAFLRSLKEFMDYYHNKELKYVPVKYERSNVLDLIEYVEFDPGRESLKMLCLDAQSNVRAIIDLTNHGGDLEASTTKAAILKAVSLHKASSVIFLHNHPTGETMPSYSDVFVTARLENLLAAEHIIVIDHLIISGNKVRSIVSREEFEREISD